jgi:hypothetical protein
MMNLENMLKMWEVDSKIDNVNLDECSRDSAKLHSKYLEFFSLSKLSLRRFDLQMAELKKDKFLYYTGKMTKTEMDAKGWAYDPFNGGTKPLKSDLDIYFDSDADVIKLKAKIEYQKVMVEALEDIMNNIRWRHATIKNIISWKQFTSGA